MQLLPSQREFLKADARSYNDDSQAVLLTAPAGLDLPTVVEALYRRHDALRLRFAFVDGMWQAVETPLTAATISESCVLETLPENPDLQSNFIRERCAHYLRSLNITHGPLFRAVYLQGHVEKQGRLFLVIHRLLIDEVSWRLLLRDLDAAHRQETSGGPTQHITKNSDYHEWGEALTAYAMSDAVQRERDYWHYNCTNKAAPWPVPPLSTEAASYASTRSVPVQLSVAETAALLKDCSATYHTNINELLLSAVYLAMRQWSGQTHVRITLEEQCRDLFPEIDVTGTIGSFTASYPLVLHSDAPDLPTVIKSVKEQCRAVPHHGIGYGLLCYVAGDAVLRDAAAAHPPVLLFRYQGELNQVMHSVDPQRLRSHALCLSGSVAAGSLRFKLEYSKRQYSKETMVEFAGHLEHALRMLIAHSQQPGAGYYTPSDFPLATVDQATLNEWQTRYAIEQLYPATAMQKGMVFHSLLDASAYVTQLYSTIEGDLQLPLLQQAWQTVIDRHAMLRTVFVGEGEEQHQLVLKRVSLSWYEEDLRGMSAEEQSARFEQYRQTDREQGFAMDQAPLMRLSVFRLSHNQYRLLWSHHHSLLDGWSIRLVYSEVMQVYAALNEGLKPVLPPVAEYACYVEWLVGQNTEEAYRYWQTYLANVETVTRLPYDTQAGERETIHQTQEVSLGAAEMAQLRALAKRHHTTVNTLLQLAWGVVLQSYDSQKEVVFGAVLSGRFAEVPEVERMVGLCINTIPVVVSFDGNESLAEDIRRLHSSFQRSQAYGYLPLTEVQKQSRLGRGAPLFESLLVFENFALDLTNAVANRAGSVTMGEFGANLQDTYPLVLSMFQGESLQVVCRYFGDLFTAATVKRILAQFIRTLQQLPNCQAVTDIEVLLSHAERQQLREWSETEREYGRERSIAAVFEEQVQERPEAVAVVMDHRSLTYEELNRRANQLGHYLQELGVGPEICVALCVERSLEMVIGMLGILKAGGAYVPLDASYPTERLAYMMADAGVAVVLTQESLLDVLPSHWAQVISLDGEWEELAQRSDTDVVSGAEGENLAYVMYTSGSTGKPKGVAVVQRGVVRLVKETNYAEFGPAETFVQMAPLTFDASTFEIWGSLLNGGRLVVLEPGATTLEELGAALRRYEVSTLWLTAGLFHLLVDERPEDLRGLRQLLAGGDVLSAGHVKKALQWLEGGRVINGYGPTENTTFSCCQRLDRADEIGAVVPIGRPIANTRAYVLNGQLQQVAVGIVGELYLGGDGLARGYQQQPELTAEKFIPHPYSVRGGERLYRTGDHVRYLEDGRLEFVGRVDNQVKVRGFRIELGEIETVLNQHAQVREAVAVAREAKVGDKQLLAYVVGEAASSELQRYLKERLPHYMVPQLIVKLEQMPLTTSGKVDRQALPAPEQTGEAAEVDYVAPRTSEEEMLASLWAEVLGVERISAHDDFFERGGHSLLATQVISRIRMLFGIDLPLRAIFDTTTLEELAQVIVAERQVEATGTGPAIESRSRETAPAPAPALSYAQQRLWFLDQLEPQSTVYNVPASILLTGELDHEALAQSLSEIARRHEVLRTSFPSVGGQPVQHIAPPAPIHVQFTDLQALTAQDREILEGRYSSKQKLTNHEYTLSGLVNFGHCEDTAALQLAAEEATRPFDLAHGPVWRVALLRLAEQEHLLLVTIHHIVTDGWSVGVLLREITTLYEAYRRGAGSPLPELPIQYADYAEWQREWLQGAVLEEQMSYWRKQLAGSSGVLELPTDHPRPAVQGYRGTSLSVQLGEELTRGLRELSQREGVTLFMTLLSGWQTLLARYSGQWDLNVGTPIANRTRGEVEGLIGFFVNTLVLRSRLQPQASFREQLRQVREVCLGAYAHQDVPFEMLVEELQRKRDMSRSPLFQMMFVLQNAPLGKFEVPAGLKLEPLIVEVETTKFDLTLTLMEGEAGLVAWCNYRTDLFEETTIVRMLEQWQVLLEAAVSDPGQTLMELPLLPDAEWEQVLVSANDTSAEYPRETCIHELFAQQVERTPSAPAVIFGDEQLSYRELNARANQLAHYLRERGVSAGEPVGLCVERSLEMVMGVLGVLKAGGAYVPLDPEHPRERQRQIVRDSGIKQLLVQQHLEGRLPEHDAQVVRLDGDWDEISQRPDTNLPDIVTAENLAYMIYTSGSTGQPKAVMVPHRALGNHMAWMQRRFPLTTADRVIQKTPFSFDASVWELFAPLLVGARLVMAVPGGHQDVAYLARFIKEQQITALKIVPSLLAALLEESGIEECVSLRYVFCGAEVMPVKLANKFGERLHAELFNLYGPTEAAIDVTYWECDTATSRRSIPIGRPIINTQAYVLDEGMRVVPIGVAGELYVGGESLAHGYWQRADLTAERFVPHPFSTNPGARLYRTGDVVRWNKAGELEYLGRVDNQVKVRGFRIELGEIETVLNEHAQVREAVAVAREAKAGDKQLLAYVVGEAASSELQRYLKERLPHYMVPQLIVKLEQMPLTTSGKVDRQALPAPEQTGEAAEVDYVAPRTPEEEMLASLWAEVLGVERVSVNDNFFERGGHSLLATQVISRIRMLFGIDLPLRAIFDTTTLEELAQVIVAERQVEATGTGPAIESRSRETAPVPALSHAQQQREWPGGAVLEEQMNYWRDQLAGSSGLLELPTDHARPPVASYRGAMLKVQLSEELTRALRELSAREGVTLFMTLLSGWQTLLARYSGQWDLNVGTPTANRTEPLIEFSANTLVLRSRLQPQASFREQLQQVREVCLGAYAHQDVPFAMLMDDLQPGRDTSRWPLFQVMFGLQNATPDRFELSAGVKPEPLEMEFETTRCDLALTLMEAEAGLVAWCNYRTDLFEETTIARMLEHWQVLLEAAVADPGQTLSTLPLLPEAEWPQLQEWNNTAVIYGQTGKCLHEIIEQQVQKSPDRIALVSGDGSWSYSELNKRANQLAHYLQRRGVGPESLVGIMMEQSAAMVVAMLGILKAGAAYLPLDPDYPRERLSFMVADAGVKVLVSEQHLAEHLRATGSSVVFVDAEQEAIQQESAANPATGVNPDNLAYVLNTSRSTGKPKGAMLAHREVVNCVLWMKQAYQLDQRDRVLCRTTPNFDPSVWEIFWPLMAGSRIVVTTPEAQLDSSALLQTIINERITVGYFVPSLLAHLLAEPNIAHATSLRHVICGDEPLGIEWVKRFYELLPQATLHHSYGTTETAIAAAETICDGDGRYSVVPIGRPLANVKLYVLDEKMQVVPIGVLGELFVGGAGLGRGYLNRPELTAEKFVPDQFSNAPGARLYRTGDLVRYLPDGNLQFHGRTDTQVKVRGVRIELGEIEAALLSHEKVRSGVVVARADQTGEKSLVGYVVAARETNLTAVELRQRLLEKLPAYMVPATFVFLSELPLLPDGKIDRSALPTPEPQMTAETSDGPIGPRNFVEEMIAEAWADVLGVEVVSIHSHFFAAGGDSMLATQVIARLRETFHVNLPLRSLFENPTIAGLSDSVSAAMKDDRFIRAQDVQPIVSASRNDELPLSFAQEHLWSWEQLQPGTPTYNLTSAFRVDGDLDVPILEQSLNEIVRRHEILRTSYVAVEGHPVQIIAAHSSVRLTVTDLGHLPESERDFEVRRLAGEEALRPFDLTKAPLLRVSLLRLGEQKHVALVSMHHIVSDAWSMDVLVDEMATLYQEFLSGSPSPLPEMPVQYADFAKWQREWLKGEVLEDQLAYWKEQLRDAPLLQLRTDRQRSQVYITEGSIVPINLPAELLRELKFLSRQNNVTLFMTLLAAFNVLLHRHTGQEDIVVGTEIANRTCVETEKLIGFFTNMLALRTSLAGDPTFTELLRRVREVSLGAYTHQDVPFTKLVDEFHVRRELMRSPLFVLQNARVKNLELSALTVTPVEFEVKSTLPDLAFVLSETGDTLTGAVTYSTELFYKQTVQQLVRQYENLLERVIADPDRVLSALAIFRDNGIDTHAVSNVELKLSRKDLEGAFLELSQASHSQ